MYIKVRKWAGHAYDYAIYAANNVQICTAVSSWQTIGGAVRAAIKLATALEIEYREAKL